MPYEEKMKLETDVERECNQGVQNPEGRDMLKLELLTQSCRTRTESTRKLLGVGWETAKKFFTRQAVGCSGQPWELPTTAGAERDRAGSWQTGP